MYELNFPWEKTALHFSYDLQLTIAITRIHFAICEVRSDNTNPQKETSDMKWVEASESAIRKICFLEVLELIDGFTAGRIYCRIF